MKVQQLQYFQKVAECGVLTKAAKDLYISPSALSKSIANLESELGVELFNREGRKIVLNKYGTLFFEHVEIATNDINKGIMRLQQLVNDESHEINIAGLPTIVNGFLVKALPVFYSDENNADIDINLIEQTNSEIIKSVDNGNADIGFCGYLDYSDDKISRINVEPLYDERVLLIAPANHSICSKSVIHFDDIKDETFIGHRNDASIKRIVQDALELRGHPGHEFNVKIRGSENRLITKLVKQGLGLAFVPDIPEAHDDGIKILNVADVAMSRTIYVIWGQSSFMVPTINRFLTSIYVSTNLNADEEK
jgi:LysR family transcriptional activator of glutamate synthase operon